MAENDTAAPMNGTDITPPPTTGSKSAEPRKDTGIDLSPESEASTPVSNAIGQAKQSVRDNMTGFGQQAGDKAREFAETGKEKVGDLLDQLAQMLSDAAGQVDDKLGEQYGAHARNAATSVQGFAQAVRDKNVDEFADDVRGYVSKSPAVALGIAAALGFGLARVVHSSLDQRA